MDKVIAAYTQAIGEQYVQYDRNILSIAESTTYSTTQTLKVIIKPGNKAELRECLRIANEYQQSVYPISKGRNWGYGARVPIADGSTLIDLSRLNSIVDYNEKLGYVTIEPGVTYNQLFKFLREKKSNLLISTTGGSGDSSLIGNTLERGVGTGLYAERLSYSCGFEVMLPDGKTIGTGFRKFGDGISSRVYRWGVGPHIDGIFTQSNLGIVTGMTMWLMPCPEHFQILFYQVDDNDRFYKLLDTLQELAINGLVRPTLSIYNNYRILSNLQQYPWHAKDEIDKTPDGEKAKLFNRNAANGLNVTQWTGEISVRGQNKAHADMQSDLIQAAVAGMVDNIAKYEMSKEEILNMLDQEAYESIGEKYKGQDLIKRILIRKYAGIPEDNPVTQAYWRKKMTIPKNMDPDRDRCGLIWICPIVPFRSEYLSRAVDIIERVVYKYKFESAISVQCMSERSINIIASIAWDRDVEGEDAAAEECYMEVHKALEEEGFYFYRETTLSMEKRENNRTATDDFLKMIKKSSDPNNILAPGRYIK